MGKGGRGFLAELRRRNVLRAAVLYIGATWALAQGIAQLGPSVGAPEWITRWFLVAAGVGFPFWLALAWFYELTPEGLKRESEVAPEHSITRLTGRRLDRAIIMVLTLAVVLLLTNTLVWRKGEVSRVEVAGVADAPAPVPERSVAVLPLVNVGGARDQQYFSDGISENLISTLSQFEGLKVIGRSSSFRFRDGKEDSKAIGGKLGVSHLLEGSVQRAGDRVRVNIELVRAADGSTVWTQRYDRPYQDLFALQDEIALAVGSALQVQLLHVAPGTAETGRPASGNLDAYNAYLRGASHMTNGDARKAIEQYAEATRLDPGYAQAWSWLGFVRTQYARSVLAGEAARAAYEQARKDIDTALRLEPGSGQAHAIRANLLATADYDWNGALAEFRTALSLVPNTDSSHGAVSRLLATLGRVKESIEERRRYIAGDPLAAFARVYLAELLASLGRLDEAGGSLDDAQRLEPDRSDWYANQRSYLAILRGDADAALAEAKRLQPGPFQESAVALAMQAGSDHAAADAALRRLIEADGRSGGDAYAIARAFALRGDADNAFEWLQRDLDRRGEGVYSVLFDPLLLRFRDDPRFAAYCARAGLPTPAGSEALGIDRIREANAPER